MITYRKVSHLLRCITSQVGQVASVLDMTKEVEINQIEIGDKVVIKTRITMDSASNLKEHNQVMLINIQRILLRCSTNLK